MTKQRKDGEVNVTSYNQSGGITAHTVHVYAPQPEVLPQVAFQNEPADDEVGVYVTRIAIEIRAHYVVDSLFVKAEAASIRRMHVSPYLAGNYNTGHTREEPDEDEPGLVFTTITAPKALHIANIVTGRQEDIAFTCELNSPGHPRLGPGDYKSGLSYGAGW